jgi:hypothetical protein
MIVLERLTITDEDLGLSSPKQCEHSGHNRDSRAHTKGDATHWVVALHDCDGGSPYVYAGCAGWVQYVTFMQDKIWMCGCGWADVGHRMVRVLEPLQ